MSRKKDYPEFMKWTAKIPVTKNGKERPYEDIKKDKLRVANRIDDTLVCPMNYLQQSLDKIQGSTRTEDIPTSDYFIKKPGRVNSRHIGKVRKIVEEYDAWARVNVESIDSYYDIGEDPYAIFKQKTEEVINTLRGIDVSDITMNRLIGAAIGIDNRINTNSQYKAVSKYTRKMLNMMYRVDKSKFLSNFVTKTTTKQIDISQNPA